MQWRSRVQVNKVAKSRFSSKSSRHVQEISLKDKSKIAKIEGNVAKGARAARIQPNKDGKGAKRAALSKEKRASSGTTSSPRIIDLPKLLKRCHDLKKICTSCLAPELPADVSFIQQIQGCVG